MLMIACLEIGTSETTTSSDQDNSTEAGSTGNYQSPTKKKNKLTIEEYLNVSYKDYRMFMLAL